MWIFCHDFSACLLWFVCNGLIAVWLFCHDFSACLLWLICDGFYHILWLVCDGLSAMAFCNVFFQWLVFIGLSDVAQLSVMAFLLWHVYIIDLSVVACLQCFILITCNIFTGLSFMFCLHILLTAIWLDYNNCIYWLNCCGLCAMVLFHDFFV